MSSSLKRTLKTIFTILCIGAISFFAIFAFFAQITLAVVIEFIIIALLSCIALGVVGVSLYFGYGYSKFQCLTCGNSFLPSPKNFLFSLWIPKKRYMKCPVCGKRHWCKKGTMEVKNNVVDVEYTVIEN